ncbi:MAG: hypothetical protein K0Q79_3271 [Flavipsychrobacter sp.]|jgi:hypothetical protein|nr:hypothetical protein [Flavipsychrobacter sp.]
MTKKLALISLTLLTTGITGVFAQTSNSIGSNFVTTAVPFLRISPDARSGAMGDAGIAITPDANAQYWNVGKIPFAEKNYGVSVTLTPWLKDLVPDIYLAYLAGYGKFGKDNVNAVSASMRYFSLGNINYTDAQGQSLGTGMPREYSFDLGYSRRLSEYLSAGVSFRYIHSAIAAGVNYAKNGGQGEYSPGNAGAADIGVYYSKTKELDGFKSNTFSFGAVASNLGSKISYNSTRRDFIPMNLGLGVAYSSKFDEYNRITFALDLNKLLVPAIAKTTGGGDTTVSVVSGIFKSFSTGDQLRQITASIGAEYWYQDMISFRAGYFYEDKTNGDRQYITCGLGVKYNVFQLNASYLIPSGTGITRNPLSNTLRFSLIFEIDKIEKAKDDKEEEPENKQ